jgi:hypothetical protein
LNQANITTVLIIVDISFFSFDIFAQTDSYLFLEPTENYCLSSSSIYLYELYIYQQYY